MSAIGCPEPAVLEALRVGHRVLIDDGHVVTIVETRTAAEAVLRVTATRRPRERLRSDEGMNFPDTPIILRATSADDERALDVAVEVADLVGLSFAQEAADVDRLIEALEARGSRHLGILAKIETRRGVDPARHHPRRGARRPLRRDDRAGRPGGGDRVRASRRDPGGDALAGRGGARAGVWATQVLESLVKTGIPTRAELTDAAMADRAECVMLNKGPFIVEGVRLSRT